MLNRLITVMLVCTALVFNSCRPNTDCINPIPVVLHDLSGLYIEGCGWVFILGNDEKLNPVNIEEQNITFVSGTKYWLSYEKLSGIGCSSSNNIKIVCLEER